MGEIAQAALAAGGAAFGIMPKSLVEKELPPRNLSELLLVDTIQQRKSLMLHMSDGSITLPGGLGTLNEFFDALTSAQLGLLSKPCALLNVGDYFGPLLAMVDRCVAEGFAEEQHRNLILIEATPTRLLDTLTRSLSTEVR